MVTKEKIKTFPELEAIIVSKSNQVDLLIIGGGPAGLTAGIYAARAGNHVQIIEKALLGGAVSSTFMIENYPGFPAGVSGQALAESFEEQAKRLGVEITWGNVAQIKPNKSHFLLSVDDKTLKAKAVVIATGSSARRLGIAGEDHFRGRGVSYCAVCDAPFYKEKNIVVAGGGNAAIEEALYLTRFAAKVQVVHRRDRLRADKMLVMRAQANPKIFFVWNSTIKEIAGKNRVEEVVIEDTQTTKTRRIKCDGVFVYIGSDANTEFVKDLVTLDKKGYIKTDEKMQTNVPGIFAAGDVRSKSLRQIVTAAADGATSAFFANQYLEGGE